MEVRKAEMEFKLNVESNQINTDVTETLKKSLDEILTRLTALEKASTNTPRWRWGHTKKNCPLNQQKSGKESAPLTAVNQSVQ